MMAKRVYWETMKKEWKKIAGASSITMFGLLFWYLILIQAITPTGYSEDMICAGNENSLCYAELNFTVNKDDIFLYKIGYDPYGRDTPFSFEPGLRDWKLQRKWGNGWRTINLNDGCTGSWCGCSWCSVNNTSEFAYAFRSGKSYQIRVVGYKNDITEDVKWSMFQVDPTWKGISKDSLFTKLISNEAGVTGGEAIFEVYNPFSKEMSFKDLSFDFVLADGKGIKSHDYFVETPVTYDVPRTIDTKECNPYVEITHNETKNIENCTIIETTEIFDEITVLEWTQPKKIPSGKSRVKIVATWDAHLGLQKIDWKPTIKIDKGVSGEAIDYYFTKDEWAWWDNTWASRKSLAITATRTVDDGETAFVKGLDTSTMCDLATCNDLRIVDPDGNEINRTIINGNTSATEISFKLERNITATNSETFYIYGSNSAAGTAPANKAGVYYIYDTFDTDTIASGFWSTWDSGTGLEANIDTNKGQVYLYKPGGQADSRAAYFYRNISNIRSFNFTVDIILNNQTYVAENTGRQFGILAVDTWEDTRLAGTMLPNNSAENNLPDGTPDTTTLHIWKNATLSSSTVSNVDSAAVGNKVIMNLTRWSDIANASTKVVNAVYNHTAQSYSDKMNQDSDEFVYLFPAIRLLTTAASEEINISADNITFFEIANITSSLGSLETVGNISILIISPTNTTYNDLVVSLNLSITNTTVVNKCWYILNGGVNTSIANCGNVSDISDIFGINVLKVYANDTSGNESTSEVNYTISISAAGGVFLDGAGSINHYEQGSVVQLEVNMTGLVIVETDMLTPFNASNVTIAESVRNKLFNNTPLIEDLLNNDIENFITTTEKHRSTEDNGTNSQYVGIWTFDSITGTTVTDDSDFSNDATITGANCSYHQEESNVPDVSWKWDGNQSSDYDGQPPFPGNQVTYNSLNVSWTRTVPGNNMTSTYTNFTTNLTTGADNVYLNVSMQLLPCGTIGSSYASCNPAPTSYTMGLVYCYRYDYGGWDIIDVSEALDPTTYNWTTQVNNSIKILSGCVQQSSPIRIGYVLKINGWSIYNRTHQLKVYDEFVYVKDNSASISAFGKIGEGCDFDGVDDRILIGSGDLNGFNLTDSQWSIEAWVKVHNLSQANQIIAGRAWLGGGDAYALIYGGNLVESSRLFQFHHGNTTSSITNANAYINPQENTWYHVVGAFDGNNSYIWIDGILYNKTYHPGDTKNGDGTAFVIGANRVANNFWFNGIIDEVSVLNGTMYADNWSNTATGIIHALPSNNTYKGNYSLELFGDGTKNTVHQNYTVPTWAYGETLNFSAWMKTDGTATASVDARSACAGNTYGNQVTATTWSKSTVSVYADSSCPTIHLILNSTDGVSYFDDTRVRFNNELKNYGSEKVNVTFATAGNSLIWLYFRPLDGINWAYWNMTGGLSGTTYPQNVQIDIGNDGILEWNSTGELENTTLINEQFSDDTYSTIYKFNRAGSFIKNITLSTSNNLSVANITVAANTTGTFNYSDIGADSCSLNLACSWVNVSKACDGNTTTFAVYTGRTCHGSYVDFVYPDNITDVKNVTIGGLWTPLGGSVNLYIWKWSNSSWVEFKHAASADNFYDVAISLLEANSTLRILYEFDSPDISFYEAMANWNVTNDMQELYIDIGNDGTTDNTVTTLTSTAVKIFNLTAFNTYLQASCEGQSLCDVPVVFSSSTSGILNVSGLDFRQDINPININASAIMNYTIGDARDYRAFVLVPINISSSQAGTVNIHSINISYNGTVVYNISAYNSTDRNNTELWVYFSDWDLNLPNQTYYEEFIPKNATSKNVSAWGQSNSTPIWNITFLGYDKEADLRIYSNESFSCINLTASNVSDVDSSSIITTNPLTYITDMTFNQTYGIWLRANYECSWSYWNLWYPTIYIEPCCMGCVCAN